ncbi:hypothetical protein [Gemmata obscuriglobus]|uniref:Uncharacterized protein n=1 Tax=Gemmata obscuriglobus TaxID=114 RepID=A0A2Z3H0V6_9BACT|nr:hypothetical protein [Gemmata obscuriglobus]AWM37377.1 hypothetical protein C1280_10390 [Gemmata obscuriglobus]VTS09181.1 unnamed protein product [Gemmata obscuriglobus UQM 2246]
MDEGPAGGGGPVVRAARVRVTGEPVRIGAPAPTGGGHEPTVRVVREGDLIQALEVTCTCGERIRIRCEY